MSYVLKDLVWSLLENCLLSYFLMEMFTRYNVTRNEKFV